ncbi:uncharacterized protein LOC124498893 [Dermatophagoides farinae]|uniref:Cell division cycle protein 26 homolog n=1 Tax=Dermatophagoides farinae TaxID=6954 RepID=A0A922I1A2_DERFA|nr:uncharacterized protein LOC124498893 [Dermatophagoides farinae]KAH7645945.1 hypothetical protein HUG17_1483 [Dermatophagoides farinae]KAH9516226.1 hypothetical protein DERF_006980 [Dermatophagoides farinae]
MYRRNLTRIQIKLDDIRDYERSKKNEKDIEQQYDSKNSQQQQQQQQQIQTADASTNTSRPDSTAANNTNHIITRQQRIGYFS